jgi:hypothetical protein
MDDFYVYYEISSQDLQTGVIKAVFPNYLEEMNHLEFIRVPPEVGLKFTIGTESFSRWIVSYDTSEEEMVLVRPILDLIQTDLNGNRVLMSSVVSLIPLPEVQEEPEVVVTWNTKGKTFNVMSDSEEPLTFYVTREGDPNILYFRFSETHARCDIPLPEVFSVYTRPKFSRYKLEIE